LASLQPGSNFVPSSDILIFQWLYKNFTNPL
jgi:hypothetical protein